VLRTSILWTTGSCLRKGIGRRRKYQEFSGLLLVAGEKKHSGGVWASKQKDFTYFSFLTVSERIRAVLFRPPQDGERVYGEFRY